MPNWRGLVVCQRVFLCVFFKKRRGQNYNDPLYKRLGRYGFFIIISWNIYDDTKKRLHKGECVFRLLVARLRITDTHSAILFPVSWHNHPYIGAVLQSCCKALAQRPLPTLHPEAVLANIGIFLPGDLGQGSVVERRVRCFWVEGGGMKDISGQARGLDRQRPSPPYPNFFPSQVALHWASWICSC